MVNPNRPSDERFRTEAFDAVWAADHDRALAALHNAPWTGSSVMRARIFSRKGLLERTLAEYAHAATHHGDVLERAELAMIAAALLGAAGRRVEAILALHEAETIVHESRDRSLVAQYRVAVADVELSSGNTREARAAVAAAFELTEGLTDVPTGREYRLEVNHLRSRLFALRAQLHALANDDVAQLDDLCRAIATAKLVRRRDFWQEASQLASISSVIGMSPQASARRLFATTSADVRWNAHLAAHETVVRFNLARAEMLFGRTEGLWSLPMRGAPSLATRLALDADRLLLDVWDDRGSYARELDFASSLAESVDWGNVTGEEIMGLATLALLLAPYDLRRSHAVKALYDLMLTKLSREARSFLEPRRVAFDDFTAGCIAKAGGDAVRARELLDGCVAFWSARGMDPWCTIASLERFSLSRDPDDVAPARRFVHDRPRSRFSARLRAALAATSDDAGAPFPYLRIRAQEPQELEFG